MIGMVTSCTGKQTLLPALLQWNIKRTDGEPCDSFSVQFLCGKTTKELLEQATEFRATEKGRVVFTGIVDDFELRLGKEGAIAELTGRGMAARLMDMQTPAAEYVSAQLEDIRLCQTLRHYENPGGRDAAGPEFCGADGRDVLSGACGLLQAQRGNFPALSGGRNAGAAKGGCRKQHPAGQ